MKRFLKSAASIVCAAAILIGVIFGLGNVLMPTHSGYGCNWHAFLDEEENSMDVLFFGSSVVYCDVVPAVLWEDTGLSSYVMAGPEQTFPITYYYVREALKTQNPQAVVVELTGLFFEKYQDFSKANIGYMPFGWNRLMATFRGTPSSEYPGLLCPIYSYHDSIYPALENHSLADEYAAVIKPGSDNLAGLTPMMVALPMSEFSFNNYRTDTEDYALAVDYLKKIADYCRQKDIKVVFYVAPAYDRIPPECYSVMMEDISEIGYDYFFDANELDFDQYNPNVDWVDTLHTNIYGGAKFTHTLAEQLGTLGLTPSAVGSEVWEQKDRTFREYSPYD